MDFTGGASISTSSMQAEAQAVAINTTRGLVNVQAIPPEMLQSMSQQGLANQVAWSPGVPIYPMQPIGDEPRAYEYMIGQNIVQRPRSTETVSFATIRSIIEMYDIAQMCIEVRQDELRNLDWDIVPLDDDDSNAAEKYSSEIAAARTFFQKPCPGLQFDEMQNMLAYDWLAFDALSLFLHTTNGGKLGALEPIDGTTVTPMVDYDGRLPQPPAPAYVQYAYGMPWVWLTSDALLYRPHRRRTNKIYGYPAVEWLLNNVNTDIRYQIYFLQWFTEGSIPDTFVNAPENMSAKQIKEYQEMYDNILAGDQAQKHKMKMIPSGAKVYPAKETKFDTVFPQFMLTKTCAAYKVTPSELGFTEKVNKSSGETQENVQYRRSIKPSAAFFASIYTGIVQRFFSPALKFKYLNLEEQEDLLMMAQRDQIYIETGVVSPDEVRVQRLGLDTDADHPVPRIFIAGQTIMAVEDAMEQSKLTVQQKANPPLLPGTEPTDEPLNEPPGPDDRQQGILPPKPAEDKEVSAAKAALDFFTKAGPKFADPEEEAWVGKIAPDMADFLQKQGTIITYNIQRQLKRQARKMAKEAVPDPNKLIDQIKHLADQIIVSYPAMASKALKAILGEHLLGVYVDGAKKAAATISMEHTTSHVFQDFAHVYQQQRTASLVKGIDDATREMLRSDLEAGMQAGLTPMEIAKKLMDNYAFSESRAQTIARTETGYCWNSAAIKTYRLAGCDRLTVQDGDYDSACSEADGQVWSVDYAEAHQLEHPNCTRGFMYADPDAPLDRGGDDNA